jgi:hypothetical protein
MPSDATTPRNFVGEFIPIRLTDARKFGKKNRASAWRTEAAYRGAGMRRAITLAVETDPSYEDGPDQKTGR